MGSCSVRCAGSWNLTLAAEANSDHVSTGSAVVRDASLVAWTRKVGHTKVATCIVRLLQRFSFALTEGNAEHVGKPFLLPPACAPTVTARLASPMGDAGFLPRQFKSVLFMDAPLRARFQYWKARSAA